MSNYTYHAKASDIYISTKQEKIKGWLLAIAVGCMLGIGLALQLSK